MVRTVDQKETTETSDQQVLDDLLAEISEKLHTGQVINLDEYAAKFPQLARRIERLLPAMLAMADLGYASQAGGGPILGRGDRAVPSPGTLGDFRILREIGRGGMGVVYEAEQISIGRHVALKVLPFAAILDPRQLNRFKNEARAAGTLDHPNIVSVYSVGTDRGVHYYSMQLIHGQSLAELIAGLRESRGVVRGVPAAVDDLRWAAATAHEQGSHHRETELPSTNPVVSIGGDTQLRPASTASTLSRFGTREYFRGVAQLGIQAAEALHYAHENGIMHRDIKPGNLLVNSEGQLWVTDFGLAHIDNEPSATVTGDIVGTLRYMSPEQTQAPKAVVDHRTDIYSLGATLYELLTLQPACRATSRQAMLREIAEGEPITPLKINPSIPRELATIVSKALEKRSENRYLVAQEMADDLCRYLDGRPISARRVSKLQRLRRLMSRHSDLVFVAAVAMLLVSLTVAAAAGMIWRAHQRTQNALAHQEAALQRATENARMVRKAADKMYCNIALQRISDDSELTSTQRRFLDDALAIYEDLTNTTSEEFVDQLETGFALARMASILDKSGKWKESFEAAEQAIHVLAPFRESRPDNLHLLKTLGQLYHNYANGLDGAGRTELALEVNRKAAGVVEQTAALEPGNVRNNEMLASIELNQSCFLRRLGRLPEAESSARRAWESAAAATRQDDKFMEAWDTSFRAAGNLAAVLQDLGRVAESEQVCRQAIDECQTLCTEYPSDLRFARILGMLQVTLASKLSDQHRWLEAESAFRGALAATQKTLPNGESPAKLLQSELKDEAFLDEWCHPSAFQTHADAQVQLGEILSRQDKFDEAVQMLTEATFVLEELAGRYPDVLDFHASRGRGEWYLARALRKTVKSGEAEQHFRKAAELYRNLVTTFPRTYESLSRVLCDLGNLLRDEGRRAEARQAYEAGIEQAEQSLAWRPDQPDVQEGLESLRKKLNSISEAEQPAAEEP